MTTRITLRSGNGYEMLTTIAGIKGRLTRVAKTHTTVTGLWQHQRFISEYRQLGAERVRVEIRFDDSCGNGHNAFAITGTVYDARGSVDRCGQCTDDIRAAFPELHDLMRFHLFDMDRGPMHYPGNAVYLAGDLDHNGKRAGEPWAWDEGILFGNSPITYVIKSRKFYAWLQDEKRETTFTPVAVPYVGKGGYDFAPKYTFDGYAAEWHECPFGTLDEAKEFAQAIALNHTFVRVPTLFSKGKPRELEAARQAACWPEATDADLSRPREQLEAVLRKRLPALLEDFRSKIVKAGFMLSPADDIQADA